MIGPIVRARTCGNPVGAGDLLACAVLHQDQQEWVIVWASHDFRGRRNGHQYMDIVPYEINGTTKIAVARRISAVEANNLSMELDVCWGTDGVDAGGVVLPPPPSCLTDIPPIQEGPEDL